MWAVWEMLKMRVLAFGLCGKSATSRFLVAGFGEKERALRWVEAWAWLCAEIHRSRYAGILLTTPSAPQRMLRGIYLMAQPPLCAEHVQQLGSESLLPNLMEVKG